jgi:hypothetical protein
MKTKSFLLIFVLFSNLIIGQTIIHNGEKVFGTWTKSQSPYIVEGEVIVPKGKVLTIKPGVVIKFKTGNNIDYYFSDGTRNFGCDVGFMTVEGTLIAKGKKNKPIIFTKNEKYGQWGNIHFVNTQDIEMEYCIVEFAQYMRLVVPDDNATGAITFINSTGTVENCLITNSWSGINCKQKSTPVIKNCLITNNEYWIEANSESRPKIINTIVWNNKNTFYINPKASINLSYSLVGTDELPEEVYNKGHNILNKNPLLDKDYKLKKNSPCKKAGENGKDIGILK